MAPAQQRLAPRHLVGAEIEQRLVVDFEAAIGHRLPQVLLHGQARLRTGIHLHRRNDGIAAAAAAAPYIARSACLMRLIQVGAVRKRQRDADGSVGREMVAEALTGLPDRMVDARHEFHDVGGAADGGLDHGEFVAAEPGDQVRRLEAILDAPATVFRARHRHDAEQIVDALELVDIDIEQGERLACLAFSSSRSIFWRNSTRFGRSVRAS